MKDIHRILLVTKADNLQAAELGGQIMDWLVQRGLQVRQVENRLATSIMMTDSENPDLIMVVGGDGTMLGVIRRIHGLGIPVLGVNAGHVGFLAESCSEGWESKLGLLLDGRFTVWDRPVLKYEVIKNGRSVQTGPAVNDVVVGRGSLARLIRLDISYGGEPVTGLRADGLITATPTGSSGYGISCGGPLVHPSMAAYVLIPICPFMGGFPPMILPMDKTVVIRLAERQSGVYLTLDGQECLGLDFGDEVRISRDPVPARFLELSSDAYFSRLRDKGFVRSD